MSLVYARLHQLGNQARHGGSVSLPPRLYLPIFEEGDS